MIKSDKIKKQKLVGVPFEATIDFNRKRNRYMGKDGFDYFDNALPKKENVSTDFYKNDVFKSVNGFDHFDIDNQEIEPLTF